VKRIDALKILHRLRTDQPMVMGIGYLPAEVYSVGPSDLNLPLVNFPYVLPLGIGLATALPAQKIIVAEGDGSAISSLPTLCTVARLAPRNLIHIVWDNESWMAPGHFRGGHFGPMPTATGAGTDFEKVARGAGIRSSHTVRELGEFEAAFANALATDGPHLIVAKVETGTLDGLPPVPFGITESAIRFRRALIDKGWVSPFHAGATMWKDSGFEFGAKGDREGIIESLYQQLKESGPRKKGGLSVDKARTIYKGICDAGIDLCVYLPDSANYLIQRFAEGDTTMRSISVTREDEGMAIAMGAFMGGLTPCIIMEASGYGLSYLALAWLGLQQRMALLMISSHTAGLGEHTDYHVCTRYVAEPLLTGMGIPHYTVMDVADAPRMIKDATMTVRGHVFPVALQLPRNVLWED